MPLQSASPRQKQEVVIDHKQGGIMALYMPLMLAFSLCMGLMLISARGASGGQPSSKQPVAIRTICSKTETYGCYTNHKYGYVIAWPKKFLVAQGESPAGDGQLFTAPNDRARLTCWAMFNTVGNKTLRSMFTETQKESGLQVTYKHMGKNFFVVSGTMDDKIVYIKTIKSKDIHATFMLTYDKVLKDAFDPIVQDVAKSFTINQAFMFH